MKLYKHTFSDDCAFGEAGEDFVFKVLEEAHGYNCRKETEKRLQLAGIDGYIHNPLYGGTHSVQIKTCRKIHSTNNMFFDIYTEGQDGTKRDGWPYTTIAQLIIYVSHVNKVGWMFDATALKRNMERFRRAYEIRVVDRNISKSGEFKGYGIAVPVIAVERYCTAVRLDFNKEPVTDGR